MSRSPASLLRAALPGLEGQTVWAVKAGKGTGSNFTFEAGDKVELIRPLTNPTLTDLERHFEGSVHGFVTCAWRLQTNRKIMCTWLDGGDDRDFMVRALRQMIGAVVVRARVGASAWDLELRFDNSLQLHVFSDQPTSSDYGCYSLWFGGRGYHVRSQSLQVDEEQ